MQQRTVGTRLHNARQQQGLTIEELQQRTKIQRRYLIALEDDDFDAIPGTFYVRAFIRQYADAVGEDGDELVDIFDGKKAIEEPLPPAPEKAEPEEELSRSRHQEEVPRDFWSYLPMITLGVVAFAIIFVVGYMMMENFQRDRLITTPSSSVVVDRSSSSTTESSSSTEETASSTTESSTTESSSEAPAMEIAFDSESGRTVAMTANNVTDPATISFTATGACWVGVQVNGEYVYQYTLAAGDTQSTVLPSGAQAATIVLGASLNVSIQLNNEALNFNPNSTTTQRRDISLTLNYLTA
ncbi:helix-turn-helix domain-containing protein [Enterococcus sp. LJL90]